MKKSVKKVIALLLTAVAGMSIIIGCSKTSAPIDAPKETNQTQTTQEIGNKTQTVTDSIGRLVEIPSPVTTAVVANAYNTEIINAINALDCVIGVDYNIYQDKESWKNKYTAEQVIGKSQTELNYEKIIELNPQVLILTSNGSYEEAEAQLKDFGIKVVVVDAYYTDQFEENAKLLGQMFGKINEAEELSVYFMDKLDYINKQLEGVEKKSVYFEYRRVGNTTIPGNFFFNMIEFSGADNIFKTSENVEIDPEAVVVGNPEYIIKVSAPDVFSSYYPPTLAEHQAVLSELASRAGWDEINALKNNVTVEYRNTVGENKFPKVTKDNKILLLSHYVHGGASKLVGTMYVAKFLYPELLPDLHPEQVFKDWLVKYQKLDYIKGHTYPAYTFED